MNDTIKGIVYLVGAGPGDPGLMTLKGKECIEKSEVIVYDYLAAQAFLNYASKTAERIYVGKKGGDHTLSQEEINALIIKKAKEGHIVTRLKGGDPFVFGRGGEEAEELQKENIPFEIVPGVTSAIAAPAYAGIPITHRKFASTVTFVTGHEDPQKKESGIDWESLAKGGGTLVFLMGVKNLSDISRQLIQNGRPAETPVAFVHWGTTSRQITITGTLNDIADRVKKAGFKAPAIIVVGGVVALRENLKWFEARPLLGQRIVVTRAREQASDLVRSLTNLGAECLEYPTIKVEPPDDWNPLDTAIGRLPEYDWLIFTSVNGVSFFFQRLFAKGKDVRALHQLRTAVIGPATAHRLLNFGVKSDIIPDSYRAESIIEAFRKEHLKDKKILLPRASEARPVLPVELTKMGAVVDEIPAYRTREERGNADALLSHLEAGLVDLITFTSSSTVRNFKALLPENRFKTLVAGVTVASIGPITSETAKELDFDVPITAETYTIQGLCEAIVKHYTS
ncbi:uroporphyrinogen-III C-methyltransferase [Thermodesulfobacteriota bacterium]